MKRTVALSSSTVLVKLLIPLLVAVFATPSYLRSPSPSNTNSDTCGCPQQSTFGLRIAYLIAVHNKRTLNDAVHLVRAIRHPNHAILVHVDLKAKKDVANSTLVRELQSCPCGTARIESVFDVKWSHWSMNLPTLWGLEQLVNSEDFRHWDVFINLSGDTLPAYTPPTLAAILAEFPYNFVTSSSCETGLLPTNVYDFPSYWHKRVHYTNYDTEPDPVIEYVDATNQATRQATIVTHFGSQWMILQRNVCEWLVREMQRPDSLPSLYADYLQKSGKLMTDETFFPSLLVHEWADSLPRIDGDGYLLMPHNNASSTITDVRYERMDEHIPSAFGYLSVDQRYQVPPSRSANSSQSSSLASAMMVEPVRPWGPYFLGVYDLGRIRESGALFVRKVSELIDPNMLRLLPVERRDDIPEIFWPDEVSIIEKPEWSKKLAEMRTKAKRAAVVEVQKDTSLVEDEEEL